MHVNYRLKDIIIYLYIGLMYDHVIPRVLAILHTRRIFRRVVSRKLTYYMIGYYEQPPTAVCT